nr:Chain B, PEPTIDE FADSEADENEQVSAV [synthetic construct]
FADSEADENEQVSAV